jgi:2-isopropylmalate synthase
MSSSRQGLGVETPPGLAERIEALEAQGYQFEGAAGSLELLARRALPDYQCLFRIVDVVVRSSHRARSSPSVQATVKLEVGGHLVHTVAEGCGPVDALDFAFRKGLEPHFPQLREIRLSDYAVRIIDPEAAARSRTRVLIEFSSADERWSTIGVSTDIIEASCRALAEGLELPLVRERMAAAATPRRGAANR